MTLEVSSSLYWYRVVLLSGMMAYGQVRASTPDEALQQFLRLSQVAFARRAYVQPLDLASAPLLRYRQVRCDLSCVQEVR